jgi:hypothetical protein
MRLRLLMRRLTISAPRMAVRSALPWPFRWAVLAIVAGFCAAIAMWAFEFGKDIAGLDRGTKEQLQQVRQANRSLQDQLVVVQGERDQARSVANSADTLLIAEKVAQEKLAERNRQLENDNQRLKDDLGFFERLIPSTGTAGPSIRSLQAELQSSGELKWQVLVIQALKNPTDFSGRLEISFSGLENGKPWTAGLPGGAQSLVVKQYGRFEGVFPVPKGVVIKGVSAKVLEGQSVRAAQAIKL